MKAKLFVAALVSALFPLFALAADFVLPPGVVLPTLPDTKEMIVTTCFYKGKTTFIPKTDVPADVVQLGDAFAEGFITNSKKDGFKTVDIGKCIIVDDDKGRINIVLKIMMYPGFLGTLVGGEASFKAPGKELGLVPYSAALNARGRTPETAALEVWENIKAKINAAPKMPTKPAPTPETEGPIAVVSG